MSNENNVLINSVYTLSWSRLHLEQHSNEPFYCSKRYRQASSPVQSLSKRMLLADVSGIVKSGQILAVVGASGVGKTTLLKVLSGLDDPKTLKLVSGTVMLDGCVTSRHERRSSSCIGHVEQQHPFIETITLEEHLIFQAMLRISSMTVSDTVRRERVSQMIELLNLENCASTIISRLSGGERKRLAFATVALTDPAVMLIDEPTSGLDSYLAKSLMRTIRMLAVERQRSIIVVLHQPTTDMFKFVDLLCVLVHGGRQCFFGDAHHEAIEFFTNSCGLRASSLDGFVEQLAAPQSSASKEALQVVELFAMSSYARSLAALTTPSNIKTTTSSLSKSFISVPSLPRQIKWLLWRSFVAGARNGVHTYSALIKTLIPALILGLLYFDLRHRSPPYAFTQNVNAILFLTINISATVCGYIVAGTMPNDIRVFLKDTQRHMYGALAFYLSSFFHDLITFIIVPVVFSTILYWCAFSTIHHNAFIHFLVFVLAVVLTCNYAAALSEFIAAFSSSVDSAVATMVPFLQTLLVFSGYLLDLKKVPLVFRILQYLSPYYYGYAILTELQWDTTSWAVSIILFDIAILFVLIIVFNALAFIVIWYRAHHDRITEQWDIMTKK